MHFIKVQEVQRQCPYAANEKIRQRIHDRQWQEAIKEIDNQIIQMNQKIITLESYKRFLNNLKEE